MSVMPLFAELSSMETCTLASLIGFVALGFAVRKAVNDAKSAASSTWSAVSNNRVARGAAKVGFWYFLRTWLR
jgi:hypothetical protein